MFLLLIFLYLKSGQVDVRTSIVYGVNDDAYKTCQEALPLTETLYEKGKFHDGPMPILIKKVRGRCEAVEEDNKIVSLPEKSGNCTVLSKNAMACPALSTKSSEIEPATSIQMEFH